MQLNQDNHVASTALLSAIVLTGIFLVFTARHTNFNVLIEDFRQAVLARDPGYSNVFDAADFASKLPDIVEGKISGFDDRPPLETVYIDINPEEYRALLSDRERAMSQNVLTDPQEVKGKIRFQGRQMKAAIRLKGDMGDHWLSKTRMSLRIKLRKDDSLLGFNEFSLQKPGARQHPFDAVYQTLIRNSGNLASVHQYVAVEFNGKPWGVMIMEEAMSSEFLEKQGRKESLVIRFSNEDKGVIEEESNLAGVAPYNDYRLSDDRLYVKMYEEGRNVENPLFRKWYSHIARSRAHQTEIEDSLYDIAAYGRALFITSIWNEAHPLWHANSRHYFNPYTLQLEPITTDGTVPYSMRIYEMLFPRRVVTPVTNTPLETNSIYNRLIATDTFQAHMADYYEDAAQAVANVGEVYDKYYSYFPLDVYQSNFARLIADNTQFMADPALRQQLYTPREMTINHDLQPPDSGQLALLGDHVRIMHYDDGKIEIYNLLPDQVHLERLLLDDTLEIPLDLDIAGYTPGAYQALTLQTDLTGLLDGRLQIETRYREQSRRTTVDLTLATADMHNPLLADTDPADLPFLGLEQGRWRFQPGTWDIHQPLVLAGDASIPAGTTLRFSADSYLIVKGALMIAGEADAPVVLQAIADSWKGVYVMNAGPTSEWRHVRVRDYTATADGLLNLTGGITFYKADVNMDDVRLLDAQGEDAINLVSSSFTINDLQITDTVSDALDSDFSTGTISHSGFSNVQGDAMDFSGSTVTITDVDARDIHDKAVSVGEASSVRVEQSRFFNVGSGVVSKDGSVTRGSDLEIGNYALAAAMSYQKKSFYPAASLVLENIVVTGDTPYIRQTDSAMQVDGMDISAQDIDVDYLYENTVMKK